jgi:hypothetical protein
MSLPRSAAGLAGGRPRLTTWTAVVAMAGALAIAGGYRVTQGGTVAALLLAPYVALLCLVWWLTRGNLLVLVLVSYLIAPSPADNLLPQVFIFPPGDLALRARDMFFLADLVLLVALVVARPPWPRGRLLRAWLLSLLVLAVYPVAVGLLAGVGQSVPAVLQGATMPLRGIGVIVLVVWWARTRGWDVAVRDCGRTLVLCAAVIVVAELVLKLLAGGQLNYSLFGYPLVVDGRPSVPGWGNNILANLFCVSLAALTFLRKRLAWRTHWVVALSVLLLVGLAYTGARVAMVLALVVVEVPVALHATRWVWARRGPVLAVLTGVVVAGVLGIGSTVALYYLNPRFSTLTPSFVLQYLPNAGGGADSTIVTAVDPETGVDLGGASISTRSGLIRSALQIWSEHPLLGTGWNGWGWAKQHTDYPQVVGIDPHNGITWLLVDTGVLGLLLLYLLPVVQAVRRLDLWWLWAVPAVATALEMVNPNLRIGHFAVLVWAFLALGFAAPAPTRRFSLARLPRQAYTWIQGREPPPPAAAAEPVGTPVPAEQSGTVPGLPAAGTPELSRSTTRSAEPQ